MRNQIALSSRVSFILHGRKALCRMVHHGVRNQLTQKSRIRQVHCSGALKGRRSQTLLQAQSGGLALLHVPEIVVAALAQRVHKISPRWRSRSAYGGQAPRRDRGLPACVALRARSRKRSLVVQSRRCCTRVIRSEMSTRGRVFRQCSSHASRELRGLMQRGLGTRRSRFGRPQREQTGFPTAHSELACRRASRARAR